MSKQMKTKTSPSLTPEETSMQTIKYVYYQVLQASRIDEIIISDIFL